MAAAISRLTNVNSHGAPKKRPIDSLGQAQRPDHGQSPSIPNWRVPNWWEANVLAAKLWAPGQRSKPDGGKDERFGRSGRQNAQGLRAKFWLPFGAPLRRQLCLGGPAQSGEPENSRWPERQSAWPKANWGNNIAASNDSLGFFGQLFDFAQEFVKV
jgi:hypothetical protein